MEAFQSFPLAFQSSRTLHVAAYAGMSPETVRKVLEKFVPLARTNYGGGKKRKAGEAVDNEEAGGDPVPAPAATTVAATVAAATTVATSVPAPAPASLLPPLPPPPPFQAALVDGEYVVSRLHLTTAATNALYRSGNERGANGLKTRTLASEVMFCLSGKRSIDLSLHTFGLKETTTKMLVCAFDDPAPLFAVNEELRQFTSPDGGSPTLVTWEELEALSPERRAMFVKFFKIGKEEVALIEHLESQQQQQQQQEDEEEEEEENSAEETDEGKKETCGSRWLAGLEGAVVTRVAIQSHEKVH